MNLVRGKASQHAGAGGERRHQGQIDRRRRSRSGRRAQDPPSYWQRVAWVFTAYLAYLAVRAVPAAVRKLWHRTPA